MLQKQVTRLIPEKIHFPESLPVAKCREEIELAIRDNQVIILAGETGSGKTTQLPKICLKLGRGREKFIGHTQPRRVAARTIAHRLCEELDTGLGELVGYQIRFSDKVSPSTAIKLMTDGILLAELTNDPTLNAYDTLIIDEAHERSLNIDFLLGYLKRLLPQRPDLKVIVTSATIEVARFSKHFDDAPIIEVSGRNYPISVHYSEDWEDHEEGFREKILKLIDQIAEGDFGPEGDVLVFLSGERDIREFTKALRGKEKINVLPLYARLSQSEQNRAFQKSDSRIRVVLATNVAETSITVPGIRYVIDPGEARISRYSLRSHLQRLPIEPISQASANQRMGRCGRVSNGVCFRLFSESDFWSRPEFTDPEIKRTNLAAVILRMLELGLGRIDAFPFIDSPDPKAIRDGFRLLGELGAVSSQGRVTELGRRLAALPIDPRLGRMLIAADGFGCIAELLVIVSAMSVQDPRERPDDQSAKADQAHKRFRHPRSDFLFWVALWRYFEKKRQILSQNQLRRLSQREYLAFRRMREWRDIHSQLVIACKKLGFRVPSKLSDNESYEAIHKSLLAGLLDNIAKRDEGKEYYATRNRKVFVFPGSTQYRQPPTWLVAGVVVETSKIFARQCAAIDPEWLLTANPSILKKHHYEPSWHRRSGRVMAKERINLFGLTISEGKRVNFGLIDPPTARSIFIREALVGGNIMRPPHFLKTNLELLATVKELESRLRKCDLLVDEDTLVQFYADRLGERCVDLRSLLKWLKNHPSRGSSLLLKRSQILLRDPGEEVEVQFPKTLDWQGVSYALSYHFEPGNQLDGVSITIPLPLLNRAPRYLFDWLVPGLLREKCIALVRSLPKKVRKQLVPVPDVVDKALAQLEPGETDLCSELGEMLSAQRGFHLDPSLWQIGLLDNFYRMNIRVVDERGELLRQGRDMAELISEFRVKGSVSHQGNNDAFEKDGIQKWDMGEIPEMWQSRAAGLEVVSYPALKVEGSGLAIRLLDYPTEAFLAHTDGLVALAMKQSSRIIKAMRKKLLSENKTVLALAAVEIDRGVLVEDLITAVAYNSLRDRKLPRNKQHFSNWYAGLNQYWYSQATELASYINDALQLWASAVGLASNLDGLEYRESKHDFLTNIRVLMKSDQIRHGSMVWLAQYPRYANAALYRMSRLKGHFQKDQKALAILDLWQKKINEATTRHPDLVRLSAEAHTFRWMLEEFRVSLFAQQMKTQVPVSSKRLEQSWQEVLTWIRENPR